MEVLVRVALVVGGLVSLRFAEIRYYRSSALFFPAYMSRLWYPWVGLTALAGLGFGLAAWMPWGRMRYRWTRALLVGVVPLVMVAHFAILYGLMIPHWWLNPSFLFRYYFWDDLGPLFALAVLVGVAVASGFVSRRERT